MCAGWRDWFEAHKRSVGPSRSDKWGQIRYLPNAGGTAQCQGIGIPQWRLSVKCFFHVGASAGCALWLHWVGWGPWQGFQRAKWASAPSLHCFVNLSLETKFLALCLDFCWPEQAISKAFSAVKGYSSPCFCVPWIFSLKGLNIRNGLMSGFFHSSHSYLKRYLHCPRAPRSSGANDSEALWWCQEEFHRTVLPKYESESTGQEWARCRRLSKVRSVITPDFLFQLWIYRTLRGDYCELLHRAKGHSWRAPFLAFSGFPCNVLSNAGNFWSSLLISFFLCHSSAFLLPFSG